MNAIDPRIDRLYPLLPAIHRMRDAERGYPLKALLRVIAEQVNVVEDDIAGLYRNWFIETADDWAVPYIGDLVGYRPVVEAGAPANSPDGAVARVLVPRREVANLIRARRRKGTLALLEDLAADVAGWPAHAVEFFRLLGWAQNINHPQQKTHRLADLREVNALDLLDSAFDRSSRSVDVRRIDSQRSRGRNNIPSVGVFVWRLKSYAVTATPAYCAEDAGPQCFTFSVLGQDAPLYVNPREPGGEGGCASELDVPVPIRRLAFERQLGDYYGAGKSLEIWAEGWAGFDPEQPVPAAALLPADLTDWQYTPPLKHIAVDPVLGRFAFPPSQLPKKGVRVSYRYGFSADLGGGEYARPLLDPAEPVAGFAPGQFKHYRVSENEADFHRIGDALKQWRADHPAAAIIELAASGVYVEPLSIELGADQSLQIRSAQRARAVIRLIDWQTDQPDAMSISMAPGSSLTLDGLLVTGRPLQITGASAEDGTAAPQGICGAELRLRHCTLVPGWGIDCDCEPKRPAEPSLELFNIRAKVCIEHSIVGAIEVHEDDVAMDPIPLSISDSIIDATAATRQAIGAPGQTWAHATLSMRRCTVFGLVEVHAMQLAENSIFNHCVNVARRQIGCMRYCYVPAGCRTPRRYRCQPDGVTAAVVERIDDAALQAIEIGNERLRVLPQYTAVRYGRPGYAQLAEACAAEIARGADDESEMGVFHDLFQPQRAANLRARLEEYTPAGMDVGIIFAS